MSTKTIRDALTYVYQTGTAEQVTRAQAAMTEVEAIEKACLMLYQQGVVHNELGEEHETTPALDAAADHLMTIGLEQAP